MHIAGSYILTKRNDEGSASRSTSIEYSISPFALYAFSSQFVIWFFKLWVFFVISVDTTCNSSTFLCSINRISESHWATTLASNSKPFSYEKKN